MNPLRARLPALRAGVAALVIALLTACSASTSLSRHVVTPPTQAGRATLDDATRARFLHIAGARQGRTALDTGVELAWYAIEPGDYRLDYRIDIEAMRRASALIIGFDFRAAPLPPPAPVGTLILLHGWGLDGDALLPWSLHFANAGYRAIAVDLRNHGRSGRASAGYGTREATDLAALLRVLREQGLATEPVHLFGVSYGAVTALLTAADPQAGIGGVVALEPFAHAGSAIRDMLPTMLKRRGNNWRQRMLGRALRLRYAGHDIDRVVAAASAALDLDLDSLDIAERLAGDMPCVILVHGDADRHLPITHSRRLAQSMPSARLLEVADETHLTLPARMDLLGDPLATWLGALPGEDGCPSLSLR